MGCNSIQKTKKVVVRLCVIWTAFSDFFLFIICVTTQIHLKCVVVVHITLGHTHNIRPITSDALVTHDRTIP